METCYARCFCIQTCIYVCCLYCDYLTSRSQWEGGRMMIHGDLEDEESRRLTTTSPPQFSPVTIYPINFSTLAAVVTLLL